MEMKKIKWLAYVMVPFLAVAVSCKNDEDENNNNNNGGGMGKGRNESVIMQIANSNLAEVNLGQLASTKGNDSLVKEFGIMMAQDHQDALDDLDSLTRGRNINLPTTLTSQFQRIKDSLTALNGKGFDTAYIQSQVMMHTQTKNLFQSIVDTTDDQSLKSYVNKYLPVIKMHLTKADSIANALGITGGGSDTTGMGNDTTGMGNDTTGVGNDTTGVGNDTTGVGNDTTGVGNDTTGAGNDTSGTGTGDTTSGIGRNYSSSYYIRRR